jgi:hypothetical protein
VKLTSIVRFALAAACFVSLPSWADKPAWAGKPAHAAAHSSAPAAGFDPDARRIIGEYYGTMARKGKCPPGLARKNNGCLPPGQAKKWVAGQPLPAEVKYSRLPPDLLKRLPPVPPDHRYVRIAGDVLLIAIGTRMVIDAVEDILR